MKAGKKFEHQTKLQINYKHTKLVLVDFLLKIQQLVSFYPWHPGCFLMDLASLALGFGTDLAHCGSKCTVV